jgi:hypothetical protein
MYWVLKKNGELQSALENAVLNTMKAQGRIEEQLKKRFPTEKGDFLRR